MKTFATFLRFGAALWLVALGLSGCSTEGGGSSQTDVSGGAYYGVGFYDPWYYGAGYIPPGAVVPPPGAGEPPHVEHPIATPPPSAAPRPTPLPSIPAAPRPTFRR